MISVKKCDKEHIRHCLLYEFQLNRTAQEAHTNLSSVMCCLSIDAMTDSDDLNQAILT